jgi:hypothetical protein
MRCLPRFLSLDGKRALCLLVPAVTNADGCGRVILKPSVRLGEHDRLPVKGRLG